MPDHRLPCLLVPFHPHTCQTGAQHARAEAWAHMTSISRPMALGVFDIPVSLGTTGVSCTISPCMLTTEFGPHRLVVRTSRRGRDNPGSTPGEDTLLGRRGNARQTQHSSNANVSQATNQNKKRAQCRATTKKTDNPYAKLPKPLQTCSEAVKGSKRA